MILLIFSNSDLMKKASMLFFFISIPFWGSALAENVKKEDFLGEWILVGPVGYSGGTECPDVINISVGGEYHVLNDCDGSIYDPMNPVVESGYWRFEESDEIFLFDVKKIYVKSYQFRNVIGKEPIKITEVSSSEMIWCIPNNGSYDSCEKIKLIKYPARVGTISEA